MAFALAACGQGGDPLTGSVQGALDGTSFLPRYGVAYDLSPVQYTDSTFEVEMSDAPVDCAHHLGGTTSASAGVGYYGEIFLVNPEPIASQDRFVVLSHVVIENHAILRGVEEFSNGATVALTSATDAGVQGTVNYSSDAGSALNGSFSVIRCPPSL
jgi:hypothetical protein